MSNKLLNFTRIVYCCVIVCSFLFVINMLLKRPRLLHVFVFNFAVIYWYVASCDSLSFFFQLLS